MNTDDSTTTALMVIEQQEHAQSVELTLGAIDCAPFDFRESHDVEQLEASFKNFGQLQDVVVVEREGGYVLVAGHRRVAVAKQANLSTVRARILTEVDSPLQEFLVAVDENERRRGYNDIERARLILKFKELGGDPQEILGRLQIKKRQAQNLSQLLELAESEPAVREAINRDGGFKMGHALLLDSWKRNGSGELNFEEWIERIEHESLSVRRLKAELVKASHAVGEQGASIGHNVTAPELVERDENGVFVFKRRKLDVAKLGSGCCEKIRAELQVVIGALGDRCGAS